MAMVDSVPSQCMNQIAKCHLINLLVLLFMVMIRFNKAEDNLTWRIEKKALKYGEDLRLYCQVEKCCTKSAGWGKWTSDNKFNTIFIDVKDFLNDGSSKYGGGIEKTGWFLIIRNITKNDLNTSYSCTYGFQVSKKKMLLEEDAFSGPSTSILIEQGTKGPSTKIMIEQGTKETEIIPDTFSIDGKQEILMKISHLIYIFVAIVAVVVFTVVGIAIARCTKKHRDKGDKAEGHLLETSDNLLSRMKHCSNDSGIQSSASHSICQPADQSEIPLLKTSDNVLSGMEHCSNDSGIIAASHSISQPADQSEIPLLKTSDNVLSGMEHCSNDSGIIAAGHTTRQLLDRIEINIPEFDGTNVSGCFIEAGLPVRYNRSGWPQRMHKKC